jgi:excinuclease ABC subunit C
MYNTNKLKKIIAKLPDAPGVYLFKDAQGKIIYIGKAKSLKKRVQSYFSRALDAKTQALVSKIADLEYRLTGSEAQAALLEASLIKANLPQYNIDLKDDKSFPWIRISGEDFPFVSIYRRKKRQKDSGALYFGPYTNVGVLRQAVKQMRRIFSFRSCKKMPRGACLYYRLKLCPAPCIQKISQAQYKEIINQISLFLDSRYEELVSGLSQKMQDLAGEQQYEEAAGLRDQISALGAFAQSPNSPQGISELEDLQKLLKLKHLPQRIEAFDISNIFGKEATGSLVSFYRGFPDKDNYRRFRIKTVEGIDDYKMLREVIRRRYLRKALEKLPLPDLVLIDGGKAHLSVAGREIKKLGLGLPLLSIAKEKENIYSLNNAKPIRLESGRPALNLIRRIRDEAHRFAVSYHHILRRKKIIGR